VVNNFNKRVSAGARLAYDILENAGSFENDIPYSEKARWTISMGGTYQSKREDPNFVVMPTHYRFGRNIVQIQGLFHNGRGLREKDKDRQPRQHNVLFQHP